MSENSDWKNLWCDRRNRTQHKMTFALVIMVLCVGVSIAYAQTQTPASDSDWKWKAAMIIQSLVAYIYIAGNSSTKKSIEKLFDKVDKLGESKMDREEHDRICPDPRAKP